MWILWKMKFQNVNFVKIEISKMWILWKIRFQKCEFCEKCDFRIVNFVKIGILQCVNFRIKCEFLPHLTTLYISYTQKNKSIFVLLKGPFFQNEYVVCRKTSQPLAFESPFKSLISFTSPPSILIIYCASYFRFYQSHWIDESRTLRCLPLPTPFSVRPDSCLQSGLGIHHFGCQFGAVFCRLSTTLDQDSKVSPGHVHRFGDSLCLRF